ncbi:histidine kinase dimerization/phospho-acceptor domain-containing protein [Halosolutus gelatinilyticus]|uniref:histidine kinase dimerization/phospho-acceptor domain-containing protein n=1 Tax=Halosolutus gelatinilyticus TaxID=2931975 RepID=UPI001FF16AD5|nr:histidine kinase dimerization/phospho-acceptor domain-containing protein [Halosolutus gelatinilyticus]
MTDNSNESRERTDDPEAGIEDLLQGLLVDNEATRRLEQLYGVAERIVDLPTETDVYDHAIAGAYGLFDVRYAIIAIPRGDQWMTVTSTRSDPDDWARQLPITAPKIDAVTDRHETVLIEDAASAIDAEVPFEGGQALCSPIGDGKMVQLVTDSDEFDAEDVHYARLLGWIIEARLEQLALNNEVESMERQLTTFANFQREVFEQTSHELRTPLTAILGYMELLTDEVVGPLSDEQKEFTTLVLRKATELDAAVETMTSSFDTRLANIRAGRAADSDPDAAAVSEVGDGPFAVLSLDPEIRTLLGEQLDDLGYDAAIVDDPADAREAVRDDPSTTIVAEVFASDETCIDAAETIAREEGNEETGVLAMSIVRDETTDMPQLGVSALLPGREELLSEAIQTILGVGTEDEIRIVVLDATDADEALADGPPGWMATTVTDLDDVETTVQEETFDLAVARVDGRTDREKAAVRTLRERRRGRRLPVVLVDRRLETGSVRYTLGGKLFIQRPLHIAGLTSMLVSPPQDDEATGDDASRSSEQ